MLIYEVNLDIERSVAAEFAEYFPKHVAEVVEVAKFAGADWFEVDGDPGPSRWCIRYYMNDRHVLDEYLSAHAPRLRQEMLDKFPGKFAATRRVMRRLRHFGEPL